MDKVILHSDLNNFYASVECLFRPELKDVPMAVAGDTEKRHGVILAKNQLAKSFGVKTAETRLEALRKCPNLVCVPPRHALYETFSKRIRNLYYSFTDRIESFGLDECWLDVTASRRLFGEGPQIAEAIRKSVKDQTGLTVSVGVSFSKTFAKLGSDLKKPDAVTVLNRENYREILYPLPIESMLYVGGKTAEKLRGVNIGTIGDLAAAGDGLLNRLLGITGLKLKEAARGENDDEVQLYGERPTPKSVGHGTTTPRDLVSEKQVKTLLFALSDMVAARLRRYGLNANGVQVSVRDSKLDFYSKQAALPASTQSAATLAESAFSLFRGFYDLKKRLPVRALAVYTYRLTPGKAPQQLDLFAPPPALDERRERLERSIDGIRNRFGSSAITRAGYLGNQAVLDTFREEDDIGLPFFRG